MAASPTTSGTHTREYLYILCLRPRVTGLGYVDDEDSDYERQGGRARKRTRKGTSSKTKKKPITLDGIVHVPMDILTEVNSSLLSLFSLTQSFLDHILPGPSRYSTPRTHHKAIS